MKKTILLAACITMFSATLLAVEPTLTLTKKSESPKSPYSLNEVNKLKKAAYGDPQNVVKVKLFPMIFSLFTLQYERTIKENMSVACDLSFLRRTTSTTDINGGETSTTISAYGLSPEFRFYPSGDASRGFFLAPYATYLNMGIKGEYTNSNGSKGTGEISGITIVGGGVLLGWKWLIKDAFAIETHLGYNYLSFTTPSTVDVSYTDGTKGVEKVDALNFSGGLPTAGLSLGYAF